MALPRLPLRHFIALVCLVWAAGTLLDAPIGALPMVEADHVAFSVATWNVRAGRGAVPAQLGTSLFDMNTANCDDPLRPRNGWGVGFMQQFLEADIAQDPHVVAFAVQEAWGTCGAVRNIREYLGWPSSSPERGGVALITRYGIVGPWDVWQIEMRNVGSTEDRWIVGGNVCVTVDCTHTVYMWSTHLQAIVDAEWPQHVGRVVDWLSRKPLPHIFMGDLNIWQNDRWSPATKCGSPTPAMAYALGRISAAGYVDAWSATQVGEGWTATVPRAGCGVDGGAGPYKRIDYVWSKGLQPVASARIGVVPAGTPSPLDHFGVKAQFVVPH
jgi:hypothetical protein